MVARSLVPHPPQLKKANVGLGTTASIAGAVRGHRRRARDERAEDMDILEWILARCFEMLSIASDCLQLDHVPNIVAVTRTGNAKFVAVN